MPSVRTSYRTKQQDLLETYLKTHKNKHFTAEDVRDHFEKKQISMGTATIYRHLERMVAEGQLHKYIIDEHSAACFEYTGECTSQDELPHFHLKCECCGKLIHLECEELSEIQEHLLAAHGFKLNTFRTVLYGLCKRCAK